MTEKDLRDIEKRLSWLVAPTHERDFAALCAEVRRLRALAFASGEMMRSPCFACGYSGAGYFDAERHACAAEHAALFDRDAWHKKEGGR